jgi:Fur family transcriptional regulator, iron response regulator
VENQGMGYDAKCAQALGSRQLDLTEMLQRAGLRPTRQRVALADLLFSGGDRHLTAEMLHLEASQKEISVSLATVYNTINRLAYVGLLRQVSVDGSKSYFDTNVSAHHHFYVENSHELIDISDPQFALNKMPDIPDEYEIARIEVVVRLRKNR